MSTAKQMSPLGYKALKKAGTEYESVVTTGPQGRSAAPKPGQPPKSSMYQELFGGKKPA